MATNVAGKSRAREWSCVVFAALFALHCASSVPPEIDVVDPAWLETDRTWDVLSPPVRGEAGARALLSEAAALLGAGSVHVAGVTLDAARLTRWAKAPQGEPLLRFVREDSGRAIDLPDLLLFIDDVLRDAGAEPLERTVWLTPGRARKAGILVHPDDVFLVDQPRRYGEHGGVAIDVPVPQVDLAPALDGDPPGPAWTARFQNPGSEAAMLRALSRAPGSGDFATRVAYLLRALRAAGAEVSLGSTVRSPQRGYLMWGAFLLSRAEDEAQVEEIAALLDDRNVAWERNVAITWRHPDGWRATRRAAREMADTYQVVYATEAGARASDHYAGRAVDLVAVALPRRLVLRAPDGSRRSFDLSAAAETRDLSLSPAAIAYVEEAYGLEKLTDDYPHWIDAARAGR